MPITATRSPLRSWSWSHSAEWKALPVKLSRPGTSGRLGSLSGPWAAISTSAVSSPCELSSRHRPRSASQSAPSSSWSKRMCGITPKRSAQSRRYSKISGCGEKVLDQSGFGANENE